MKVKLSDVCEMIPGFAFKSKDFGDFSDKVIKITNITPPKVDMDGLVGVDLSNYDKNKLSKYIAKNGDYVLAMTGATIGKIGRIEKGKAYINQRVLLFHANDRITDDFLYYIICQYDFAQYINNHIDSESAQPNISAKTIGQFEFDLPDMHKQLIIGNTLNLIDKKIQNNNALNKNLYA